MNDVAVIDRFLIVFANYIDSGFGLLGGEVAFLTATLIVIDITIAGLYWAMSHATGQGDDVIARLIRKVLYVGVFAYIIGNFNWLASIVFRSFAGLGLTASGSTLTQAEFLQPGRLAKTGIDAAAPIMEQIGDMTGFPSVFTNLDVITVLFLAWLVVILSFFILAIQLFITLIEFKLTTLAGFVLVPFALWNRTSFLAERVLGNVVSSGIKVMVLAVIVGIGSNFFDEFTAALRGQEPDIGQAMSLVLASLTLFGLGIFGPGIASGLVAGAPQLGAGAAVGTTVSAAGIVALGGGAAMGAARAAGGAALGAIRAGTTMGSAASTSYQLGQTAAGSTSVGAGIGGMAQAAGNAVRQKASTALGLGQAAEYGRDAAWFALNGGANTNGSSSGAADDGAPSWAQSLRRQQDSRHHRHVALQALKEGDRGGASATPDIKERED